MLRYSRVVTVIVGFGILAQFFALAIAQQPALPVPQPALPVPQPALPARQPALPVPQPALPVPQPALPARQPAAQLPALPAQLPALPAQQPGSPAERKIRAALQEDGIPPRASGDPILDDVLGIIQQRGSVLDGSSLDPTSAAESDANRPHAQSHASERAYVAEQLLKASRLLENTDSPTPRSGELVRRMRAEAVILLSE